MGFNLTRESLREPIVKWVLLLVALAVAGLWALGLLP